jgi:hypothetical protein
MKRFLRIFALLVAASMLLWIAGCGDDDDDDDDSGDTVAPTLTAQIPAAGGTQAGNANVVLTYDENIASATIASGGTGTATPAGTVVTIAPSPAFPPGAVTLVVTVADAAGNETTTTVSFTAAAEDTEDPALGTCDPADGASNVTPDDYPDGITIGFSEPLSDAKLTSKDPDFKSTEKLSADGTALEISFLQYSLPFETTVTIGVQATDLAGRTADLEYTFTTEIKPE